MIMSTRALALFLGSLVLFTWGVQAAALHFVGDVESPAMTPWLLGSMFVPTLWSVVYLTLFNRGAWKLVRFWPGNPVYLLLGALIPAALAFGVLAVSLQQGWGGSSFFAFSNDGANVLRGPWTLGLGEQGWAMFAANVTITAIVFAGLNGVVAVGEEFGWRGVLQHHMIERLGFLRGVAILGFVWAIWHMPLNLAGYNHAEAPLLGALVLFPLQLIAISFIMAWLTMRAKSFWPAVLMHGSGNGIEEGVTSSLTLAGVPPLAADYLMLALTIALALVCIALTPRRRMDTRAAAPSPTPA
jgi:membrane protease YdiL (CAAX protease family)